MQKNLLLAASYWFNSSKAIPLLTKALKSFGFIANALLQVSTALAYCFNSIRTDDLFT